MKIKLSDAFDLQMGKTPSRNEPLYWNGSNKWISIGDIGNSEKYINSTKECITDRGIQGSGIKIVPKGTVIMSFKLSLGKVAITAEDMYTNEAIMAFVDKGLYDIDTDYFYHQLCGMDWHAGTNKAVMGLTLNKAALSQRVIELPSLEEQRHIAAVLDKVSDLIALRKQQLAKLDELVKARFVEMFGDPVRNEKGFGTKPGKTVFNISNGKFVPEGNRSKSGIPVYGGNGISWYTDDALCQHDTIVIGRVGFQSGNVHFAKGPLWISDNAMYISDILDDGFDLLFLFAVMEHINFTRFQDAGDLKKITQKPFLQMQFIKPPMVLQKQYVAFAKKVKQSKVTVQQGLDKLETLKFALMQEYFG